MSGSSVSISIDDVASNFSSGQVKLNSYSGGIKPSISGWVDNIPQQFTYGAGLEFSGSPTTTHPFGGPYPFYDQSTGVFLEDPIEGLVTLWRITYGYSNKAASNNMGFSIGMINVDNPSSSFISSASNTMPSGSTSSGIIDFSVIGATANISRTTLQSSNIITIADSNSIGSGYRLFGVTTASDGNMIIEINSVTKISLGSF